MGTQMKTGNEVRKEIITIIKWYIQEREQTGDPEGADILRGIVSEIKSVDMRSNHR